MIPRIGSPGPGRAVHGDGAGGLRRGGRDRPIDRLLGTLRKAIRKVLRRLTGRIYLYTHTVGFSKTDHENRGRKNGRRDSTWSLSRQARQKSHLKTDLPLVYLSDAIITVGAELLFRVYVPEGLHSGRQHAPSNWQLSIGPVRCLLFVVGGRVHSETTTLVVPLAQTWRNRRVRDLSSCLRHLQDALCRRGLGKERRQDSF